jgi:quercetin dioxygenase-like cupin family protein
MEIIKRNDAPVFQAGGTRVTGYAAPSRGATEVSVWRLELAPGSTSPVHHMDREEVFLALEGSMVATVDGTDSLIAAGDCLILPAGTPFSFHVPGDEPFRGLACMPAGGLATMSPDGPTFPPPWAQ